MSGGLGRLWRAWWREREPVCLTTNRSSRSRLALGRSHAHRERVCSPHLRARHKSPPGSLAPLLEGTYLCPTTAGNGDPCDAPSVTCGEYRSHCVTTT
jgi:hypothetical protein